MKTLLLFKLPDGKGQYATRTLLPEHEFPRRGHSYLIMDQVYEVTHVVEPISDEGGNALMIKLLNLDQPDSETIMNAVGSMLNLDKGANPLSGLEEPDQVILVRLKKVRKQSVQLGSLVLDVQELLAQAPEETDADGDQ